MANGSERCRRHFMFEGMIETGLYRWRGGGGRRGSQHRVGLGTARICNNRLTCFGWRRSPHGTPSRLPRYVDDVGGFRRDCRSLVVEQGDKGRVDNVDQATEAAVPEGRSGEATPWQPRRVGGKQSAVEIWWAKVTELRVGDRSHTAEDRPVVRGWSGSGSRTGRRRSSARALHSSTISAMFGPRPFIFSKGALWTT